MKHPEPCKCGGIVFWRKSYLVQVTRMKSVLKLGPWICHECHPTEVDEAIDMLHLEDWNRVSEQDRKLLKKYGWSKGGRK